MAVRVEADGTIYVDDMKVDPVLLTDGYNGSKGPHLCRGRCCVDGVWVELRERDAILAAKELISRHMDETQPRAPSAWFGPEEEDKDFASGRCAGTESFNGKCVFLMKDGRCVLQHAAVGEGMEPFALKPFYCALFPLVITERTLTYEDAHAGSNECCTLSPACERPAVEAWKREFIRAIGEENYRELLSIIHQRTERR